MFKVWGRASRRQLIERIEMYAAAGLPISEAISQAGRALPAKQALSIERVCALVDGGQLVSSAFASEIGFPPAIIGIISCGESSGSLSQALKCGHGLLEREDELMKKCASAMTYPCVIGFAAAVLTLGLVRGIMPQIAPLLLGLHADLPILTIIVMKASDLLIAYGIQAALLVLAMIVMATWSYRRMRSVRSTTHTCILRIPIAGGLIKSYALAVFFQSMGALAESGMPADRAYARAVDAVSLIPLKKRLGAMIDTVSQGSSFEAVFAKGMPSYIAPLVAAGEASGNLSASFTRAAAILDREMDHSLKRMTALIEPVMMIFMGCTVGAIALSIMMPIYDISKTLQH